MRIEENFSWDYPGLFLLNRIYREVFECGNFTQSLGRLKWKILSGFEYKSFKGLFRR